MSFLKYPAAPALVGDITPQQQIPSILNQQSLSISGPASPSTAHMGTQSAKDAFQSTVQEISDTTGFPIVAIERYDAARQVMVFEGAIGVPLPEGKSFEVPVHQTLSGTVVATQQAIIKTYAPNELKLCSSNDVLSALGIRTFVCIPLVVERRTIGALSLGHPELVTVEGPLLRWITRLARDLAWIIDRYPINPEALETDERLWLAWNAAPLIERGRFYGVTRDLSQQKASEAALRESEERYRQLVDICPDGILIHQEGRVVLANQALLRLFGASRAEDLIGREVISLVHPADQELMRQNLAETCCQEGPPPLLEEKLVRLDGSTFDAEVVAIAYRYQGQMAVQAVIRDISDRKQTERARRQQDERERLMNAIAHRIRQSLDLSEILNTTVDEVRQFLGCDRTIVFRLTAQGDGEVIVESVIPPWESILGFSFFDPCFRSDFTERYREGRVSAVADVRAPSVTPCYRQVLEALQIRANLIVPIVQGDRLWGLLIAHQCGGPRVWQPFEIDLLKQLATQVAIAIQQSELYQQVQTLNVTLEEQVRDRTAQLQRSIDFEALLKRITDQVRDSLDEHKILQSAVQSLAEGLGVECCDTGMYNAEQTTSTICYEYTTTLPRARGRVISIADHPEQYQQLFQGQPLQVCPIAPTPARNLARRWAILACPIADDQGVIGDLRLFRHSRDWFDQLEVRLVAQVANQCAIAIRQARLFEESQAQVRELERLNQLKDDFLSTVSHELRTPMANIKMAIQLLEILLKQQDWFNEPSNPAQRYFGILNDECDREITLINDLLDLSRLDAGTEPLVLATIQPHLWLPSLIEPFYGRIEQQKQRVEILTPEDLPPLTTDLKHLSRVLMELISNACKYTPAHETITLAAARQGEGVEFQVSNSGVEISETEQGRIFDKFYRIPNSDPWRHGGTGLGLALAKKLVEYLGGSIAVSSGDRRTTFTITLPLQPLPRPVEDFSRIFQAPRDPDA
ncbi:GAF domain-containing protein [Geitlerinema sp. PCC 7407]|uniref:sensor histidine kinase n=1 Tax=Geitlerinema sp. PCC 7407 TaxID=1173025 RepID=UPI0012370FBE|nr:GAF domain-containing protein [Geitlerinema sp. PCC 7407]